MMKVAVIAIVCALCLQNGAYAGRSLSQLPVLGSAAPVRVIPAPAPAPTGSLACAAAALQQSGNYTTLLKLIQASSEPQLLLDTLSSPTEAATVFAPTDGGITKTAAALNLDLNNLLTQPDMLTDIIMYHILPSQLSAQDLQDSFSFNTLYEMNGVAQSVAVQGNGVTATIQGAQSSAPIIGNLNVCDFVVYPIDGLLVPAS